MRFDFYSNPPELKPSPNWLTSSSSHVFSGQHSVLTAEDKGLSRDIACDDLVAFESPAESRGALVLGQSNQGLRNFHKMPDVVVVILAQEDCARIKKGDHDAKL